MRRAILINLLLWSILFALLGSCTRNETNPLLVLSYRCCDSTCIDSLHLIASDEYDQNNRLTKRIEYVDELPGPYRIIYYKYSDLGISERIDSSQYSKDVYRWEYEQGRPIRQTIIKSWLTVVNEIPDTIPHTEWRWFYDTSFVHFAYQKEQLVRSFHLQGNDTISITNYRYGNNNKVVEVEEGSIKWKLYYNSVDSLIRKEKWYLTGASANDSVRWQILESTNRVFNEKNQLMKVETIDEITLTGETHKFLNQPNFQRKLEDKYRVIYIVVCTN